MGLWELITGRQRGLTDMDRSELRQQELLLGKERDRLMQQIEKLAADKQTLFRRGAETRSPELRRALAMEFEARTNEQLLHGRQLNIRTKELLTVTRVRLARENQASAGRLGLGRISERDMVRLARMIENDAVSAELYSQRLDEMLVAAGDADKAAQGESSEAVADLMSTWERMDRGQLGDVDSAFAAADRTIRARAEKTIAEQ